MKRIFYLWWILLLVLCVDVAVAQTGATTNIAGTWIRKAADNTPDIPIAIVQSGTNLTLTIMGTEMTGSLQGGKVAVHGIPETGTVEPNGNSIRWSDGVWIRSGNAHSVPPTTTPTNPPPTNPPASDPSATAPPSWPDFKGNWAGYYPDGSKSPYLWAISQSGAELSFTDIGAGSNVKFSGRLEGNRILDSNNKVGLLDPDGKRIAWSDKVVWVREEQPPTAQASPTPPPPVSLTEVRGNSTFASPAPDLNGKWTGYYENGSVARNPGTILQNGAIAMIDNGEGGISPGQIQGNTLTAKGWNLTGTISADGKVIRWSNNTIWLKQ